VVGWIVVGKERGLVGWDDVGSRVGGRRDSQVLRETGGERWFDLIIC
jgi:hypothetical protein